MARRYLLPCVIPAFALAAAVLGLMSSPKRPMPAQRLPDGSTLRIASVTYGTNSFHGIPHEPAWETFLRVHLPSHLQARLGWFVGPIAIGSKLHAAHGSLGR